jgi:putative PIN family toxin of toxin-antitoxin system
MNSPKSSKVIFDTNVWISFLIGKRLQFIQDLISDQQLLPIFSDQLLLELKLVTQRPKLKKYFPQEKVDALIQLLLTIGQKLEPNVSNSASRDPKDNFLLDLAETAAADFLITGDHDLLILNPFKGTRIVTPAEFELEVSKMNK